MATRTMMMMDVATVTSTIERLRKWLWCQWLRWQLQLPLEFLGRIFSHWDEVEERVEAHHLYGSLRVERRAYKNNFIWYLIHLHWNPLNPWMANMSTSRCRVTRFRFRCLLNNLPWRWIGMATQRIVMAWCSSDFINETNGQSMCSRFFQVSQIFWLTPMTSCHRLSIERASSIRPMRFYI